jgi:pyruvate/2-oxoacid:ferredoxin oxidoreductase beta subunit
MAIKVTQASVENDVFPLYEIEGGLKYTITHHSRNLPVEKYLMMQGRYKHLKKKEIQGHTG